MTDSPIYLVTVNLAPHDAIGNDLLGMRECLIRAGYRVEAYAEDVHPSLANVARPLRAARMEMWKDPKALLIYHHSMGWPAGEGLLEGSRNRIAVKYHNVTPPRFFEPYSDEFTRASQGGETANLRIAAHRTAMFWGDSSFNRNDLVRYGAPDERSRVLAPFHNTEQMMEVSLDRKILKRYQSAGAKILFVGGVKPNKGHLQLLRVFSAYRRKYDFASRLFIVGGMDPRLDAYSSHLRGAVAAYGLENNVVFSGGVSRSELRSYFLMSDVFLCLSEHEGFCVPLIEAMFFRNPVIAAASTAIPETVGDAGILWPEDELACFVESIAVCVEDHDVRRGLQEKAWQRFQERYRRDALAVKFLNLVEEILER